MSSGTDGGPWVASPYLHLYDHAANVVICCQDYDEGWVLGNLEEQSVREILDGEEYARARRIVYGVDPPPEDFICDNCHFALRR